MRVDQVTPHLAQRDAIGIHTVNLRDALRASGLDSDIFYGSAEPEIAALGRPVTTLGRSSRDRWLLYQSSVGSPVYDLFASRSEPKLINYHNITPSSLLVDWEPEIAFEVALGRAQLGRMASESRLAVADSAFNESELIALGFHTTAVAALLIDMQPGSAQVDRTLLEDLARRRETFGGADLVFVGRVSPHKAPHDLVKMLVVLRELYEPHARLHLVGSPLGERYEPALRAFIHQVGLDDAVFLTGSVSGPALEAYYQFADVFVCASSHEGFCVPLVEAMGHDLPIVAYGAAAIPETVGGAALLLHDKSPGIFAGAVARVLSDSELRRTLSAAGRARVASFDLTASKRAFVSLVRAAVEGAP